MKKKLIIGLVFLAALLLYGCDGNDKNVKADYYMYYVNNDGNKLVKEPYSVKKTEDKDVLKALIEGINKDPGSVDFKQAKPENVRITDYTLEDGQLFVYFNDQYLKMAKTDEILCRAAIVRTLTQVKSIETVSFYVNEVPLQDTNGEPIGLMTADSFVENTGSAINTYKLTVLNLYFSDSKGTGLVKETVNVRYSSNISMEKLVIERLIKGPTTDKARATMPKGTKLISASIKDGVCYVNFNEAFAEQTADIKGRTQIYSLVNSLSEVPKVNKVQISINGKNNVAMKDDIKLDKSFERDLDMVTNPDTVEKEQNPSDKEAQ